jgi:chromosome segregation ATPase
MFEQQSKLQSLIQSTNEQINNLEAAYERQNNQFNTVTNQLQSNLKQQEQRYQEEIKATRKEHVKNLQNVASNFKTQIGDFKNQVANQFATERKNKSKCSCPRFFYFLGTGGRFFLS